MQALSEAQRSRACRGEGAGEPALSPGVAGSRCLGKRQRVVRQPALNHPGGSRSGGHPGVCGACAGHRPQPGSRQPCTWDGAGPPPRDPRPPTSTRTLPLRTAPATPRSSSAPPGRLEPPPNRGGRGPSADPSRGLPHSSPTDLLPPTRREPKPVPQSVSATPGADQITGGQLWLRLPGPAPRPPSLRQPPGAAPPLWAAGGGRAAEGAPCSPGGHDAHATVPGGEGEWDPCDVAAAPAPGGSPQLSRVVWQGQEDSAFFSQALLPAQQSGQLRHGLLLLFQQIILGPF